jgi:hypothetical protein
VLILGTTNKSRKSSAAAEEDEIRKFGIILTPEN